MALQLYIGNKNYSTWSMRPWLLMRELGIGFEEIKLRLDFAEGLGPLGDSAKVPVLVDDGFAVWDTLAIVEYLHERFAGVWPTDSLQRARARSLCAEMHAGFGTLRTLCPMNIEAPLADVGARLWNESPALRRDVARLEELWSPLLVVSGGAMLYGEFTAVDAYFAPVCSRLRTYALPVSARVAAYVERVLALPSVREWEQAALDERDFLDFDEPYRQPPVNGG
jgi:glutathione S-transferase